MTGPYDKIPEDPEALRQAIVDLTAQIKEMEHIGRRNRLSGWCNDLEKRLVALGGNSEREVLPLLNHPSGWVRYSAAYLVRPFDRALFIATLETLEKAGGDVGHEAKHSLKNLEFYEKLAQSPTMTGPGPYAEQAAWQKNNPPPAAMTQGELWRLIADGFPEELAAKLIDLIRPAIDLWPSAKTTPPPLGSRLGGTAMAPSGWEWPTSFEEPHYFLAQINCSELVGLPGAEIMPKKGMLSFFADGDALNGCSMGAGADLASIFYWPDIDDLQPHFPPLPLDDERPAEAIILRPRLDLPDWRSDAIKALGLTREQITIYSSVREALMHHNIPEDVRYYYSNDKLFGWSTHVQDELQFTPTVGPNAWHQLLQLGCHIGPGGTSYFMIHENDLAAGRFNLCESASDCT